MPVHYIEVTKEPSVEGMSPNLKEYDLTFRITIIGGDIQDHFFTGRIFIAVPGLDVQVGVTNMVEVLLLLCHLHSIFPRLKL